MVKKSGRPTKYTVDYFPHFVSENKTVKILEYKFGARGYAGYYKLLELIGDTECHRVSFNKTADQFYALHRTGMIEDEFTEMIDLLIGLGKVDKELWNTEKVIWIDDFVTSLSAVYHKRKRPLPTKDCAIFDTENPISVTETLISGTSNSQYSIVKESKEEESEAKDMTPPPQFDLESYSKQYPTLDVELSFERYKLHCKEKHKPLSDKGFNLWVRGDMNSGWNQKTASEVDKSNEFVTMYCLKGHDTKQVKQIKADNTFCETCKEQMVYEYEFRHNRGVSR